MSRTVPLAAREVARLLPEETATVVGRSGRTPICRREVAVPRRVTHGLVE